MRRLAAGIDVSAAYARAAATLILHDRAMLVDMIELATSPRSPGLALIRTAFGDAWVQWCGDPAAPPGEYHVEWTIDDDITWERTSGQLPFAVPVFDPEVSDASYCGVGWSSWMAGLRCWTWEAPRFSWNRPTRCPRGLPMHGSSSVSSGRRRLSTRTRSERPCPQGSSDEPPGRPRAGGASPSDRLQPRRPCPVNRPRRLCQRRARAAPAQGDDLGRHRDRHLLRCAGAEVEADR